MNTCILYHAFKPLTSLEQNRVICNGNQIYNYSTNNYYYCNTDIACLLCFKVLGDDGAGYTSTTVHALEYLYDFITDRKTALPGTRSVLSMSLGGDCELPLAYDFDSYVYSGLPNSHLYYCERSSDIIALQKLLADQNAVAAVASGNEYTNACFGSPAFSPSAVTGMFFFI